MYDIMEYKYTVEFLDELGTVTHEKQYPNIIAIQNDLHLTYEAIKLINAHSEGIPIARIQQPTSKLYSLSKKYRIISLKHTIHML